MPGRIATLILVWLMMCLAVPVAARPPAGRAVTLTPAAGVFLVARRNLPSPNFFNTVVLVTRHDDGGTLGVIVNRRTGFDAGDLLPDVPGVRGAGHAIHIGGPVAPHHVVMLLRGERPAATVERITDEISFCADRDVLETLIARNKPASELRLYAGHAGWAPGQLDDELGRGDWYVVQAEVEAVFGEDSERLWERLINRLDPPGIRVDGGRMQVATVPAAAR